MNLHLLYIFEYFPLIVSAGFTQPFWETDIFGLYPGKLAGVQCHFIDRKSIDSSDYRFTSSKIIDSILKPEKLKVGTVHCTCKNMYVK